MPGWKSKPGLSDDEIVLGCYLMADDSGHLAFSLPDQKNYEIGYGLAFKLAVEKLAAIKDLEEMCRRSESTCQSVPGGSSIEIEYLNSAYRVTLPEGVVTTLSATPIELRDQILILHYMAMAGGTPLSGRLVAFQELKEIAGYYPTFLKRAVEPLIDFFSPSPERLIDISLALGGRRANIGDMAVTIPAFKRVPITLVLWKGDEEFPPDAKILFDSTVQDYLPNEDIIVLCQTITWLLIKKLKFTT
jgi:hypothetical protein